MMTITDSVVVREREKFEIIRLFSTKVRSDANLLQKRDFEAFLVKV